MLRSPLKWVGGKYRVREQILKQFPPHICYVEVFSGAAWVLLGKVPETSRSEVLNDLDGELINFWRVVKHRPVEFSEAASQLLAARELFEEWRALPGSADEIARAVQFYCVMRLAYGAKRTSNHFGYNRWLRPSIGWPQIREDVAKIVGRLRQVWIERLTWEQCLAKYDGANTFFYLDPPYRTKSSKSYRQMLTDDGHARLAGTLLGIKGKFLLSYNDDQFLRKLYARRGITIGEIDVRYSVQGGCGAAIRELLIRNF